jgi:hypothetical protein
MGSEKKNRIFDKKFICLDDSQWQKLIHSM